MELHLPPTHRSQFFQLREHVKKHIELGYSFSSIWESLKNSGEITMSYSQFCRYIEVEIPRTSRRRGKKD